MLRIPSLSSQSTEYPQTTFSHSLHWMPAPREYYNFHGQSSTPRDFRYCGGQGWDLRQEKDRIIKSPYTELWDPAPNSLYLLICKKLGTRHPPHTQEIKDYFFWKKLNCLKKKYLYSQDWGFPAKCWLSIP